MLNEFSRTELNFGRENMQKLYDARVAVFGIGGVGGHVVEALVRTGVGQIDIIDDDEVCLSNLNRQIFALHSTLGMAKVDAAEQRIHDINPECIVHKHKTFFLPENAAQFDFSKYDYVVDCIDTVTAKIQLVMQAREAGVPIISSMGAGNKVNPAMLEVADISKTSVCPLARVMRRELKSRGVEHLKVVYSKEPALPAFDQDELGQAVKDEKTQAALERGGNSKKRSPGSNAFVPSVAGLIIASEVVKDITGFHNP